MNKEQILVESIKQITDSIVSSHEITKELMSMVNNLNTRLSALERVLECNKEVVKGERSYE